MKYSLILSNNKRSYEYLKLLVNKKKFPKFIVHLNHKSGQKEKKKIFKLINEKNLNYKTCRLYTSDAADDRDSV